MDYFFRVIGKVVYTRHDGQSRNQLISMPQLGSVTSPVIQANGRLTFEDNLRSGGLLCLTTE